MNLIQFYTLLFFVFSCVEKEAEKKDRFTIDEQNQYCAIDKENEVLLNKILNTSMVKSTLLMWNSIDHKNLVFKTNMPVDLREIRIDTFEIQLCEWRQKEKDLILTLKKEDCDSGSFF
jgi:hypothetical protein